ncbi:hypothetical protein DK28_0213580 [Peptococcaceae bacterium SCADC1_2_3]|nr:hypothetical protein DK28_0213580 [Peptococcaceae bacterium SCADC1_2_3]
MNVLYLDCFSGISGDMALGALIDAGANQEALFNGLKSLSLPESYRLLIKEEKRQGWRGLKVTVQIENSASPFRSLKDIRLLITSSHLPPKVQQTAMAIFARLAAAEGKVHGISPEEVHFHEVGAVDALIEIVGTAIVLAEFKIQKIYCSPLPLFSGTTHCQHGIIPLPAPATAELIKGVPTRATGITGELVTPTGASIATTLAAEFGPMPALNITHIGYGLGSQDFPQPNFLRVFIGQEENNKTLKGEDILVLETNIDDMPPEILPAVVSKLLAAGAQDVFLTPLIMKKGRPGYQLTVLCYPQVKEKIMTLILKETSTLGVRMRPEKRQVLPREIKTILTPYGPVEVKIACLANGEVKLKPEFDSCYECALKNNRPIREVYLAAQNIAQETLTKKNKNS